MPLFQYKAIGLEGKEIKGIIDADSLLMAKERLRKQKLLITSLNAITNSPKSRAVLTEAQLLSFTRELAQLLKAGLPLYEALVTIEEKHRSASNHVLFASLCDLLKNGSSLSSALARYPETFHEIYLSMVRASEQSGSLHEAFEQLTLLIIKQQKLKKQLFSSLAYPAFLGCFCILVMGALFFFVIPSMKELFEGRPVHVLTGIVIALSDFLRKYAFLEGLLVFFTVTGVVFLSRVSSFRKKCSQWLLSFPYVKKIAAQSALIRFFRGTTMLLQGGVPLVESLKFARKIVHNQILGDLIMEAEAKMVEGEKMSRIFSKARFIPPLVVRMLAVGEETGNMQGVMLSLAEIYEEELDKDLQQLSTFLQPALLLFLGGVVGIVVLSILLPLTDVSSFVSS